MNGNTAHCVDQLFKSGKVDLHIIFNRFIVQIAQSLHGAIHAKQATMGQFIPSTAGSRILHIIVAGGIDQQDLFAHGIDHSQNINVTSAALQDLAMAVRTTDIYDERLQICEIQLFLRCGGFRLFGSFRLFRLLCEP